MASWSSLMSQLLASCTHVVKPMEMEMGVEWPKKKLVNTLEICKAHLQWKFFRVSWKNSTSPVKFFMNSKVYWHNLFTWKGHHLSNLIATYNFQVNELTNPCAFYFPTSEFLERHKRLNESWKNSGGITIVAIPKNMVQISATRAVEWT